MEEWRSEVEANKKHKTYLAYKKSSSWTSGLSGGFAAGTDG